MPAIVVTAFACELFLKTLLMLEGKDPEETHNLYSLFKRLDNKTNDRLDLIWRVGSIDLAPALDEIEKMMGKKLQRDLRTAVKNCGNAFVATRYHYEATSSTMYYLTGLPRVLHTLILERKPEWDAS